MYQWCSVFVFQRARPRPCHRLIIIALRPIHRTGNDDDDYNHPKFVVVPFASVALEPVPLWGWDRSDANLFCAAAAASFLSVMVAVMVADTLQQLFKSF